MIGIVILSKDKIFLRWASNQKEKLKHIAP